MASGLPKGPGPRAGAPSVPRLGGHRPGSSVNQIPRERCDAAVRVGGLRKGPCTHPRRAVRVADHRQQRPRHGAPTQGRPAGTGERPTGPGPDVRAAPPAGLAGWHGRGRRPACFQALALANGALSVVQPVFVLELPIALLLAGVILNRRLAADV